MGRKPDTLITSFFERGQKLGDNSNRYEQTCRACGMLFPKGRNEVLMKHILKNCTCISFTVRQRLVLEEYELENFRVAAADSYNATAQGNASRRLQLHSKDNHQGLDLLAEASHRLGIAKYAEIYNRITNRSLHVGRPSEDDELTLAYLNLPEDRTATSISSFQSHYSESPPPVPHPYSVPAVEDHQQTPSAQQLRAIAASTHDAMNLEPDFNLDHSSFTDEQLLNGSADASHHNAEYDGTGMSIPSRPVNPLRSLASKSPQFVLERTPEKSKHKIRRPYTPERRNDVYNMRRIGACLRCRILKKPCSGGNPCLACAAIGTPRIWNEKCIRTKLANQCNLFSAGILSAVSYRETMSVKGSGPVEAFKGYVAAFHFDHMSDDMLLLNAVQVKVTKPTVQALSPLEQDCGILMLDSGSDELVLQQKVIQYLKAIVPTLCQSELNPKIIATIEAAHKALAAEEDDWLQDILELHSAVKILVDPGMAFKLVAYTGKLSDFGNKQLPGPGTPIIPERWPQSYHFINAQLVAITDKHVAIISKRILTDLEKRLVHKNNDKQAHVFIGVLLLLNCMERMSHLFACYHPPDPKWPLEKLPHQFNREGDQFAQVLDSMMQMRSITPSIKIDPVENILIPVDSYQDQIVRQWFLKVAVTANDMMYWKASSNLIREDYRSLDMKLIFHVIRPKAQETPKKNRALSVAPDTSG